MITIDQLYDYCLSKKGVTEHFPFDDNVLVFKVLGKMFLLSGLDTWEKGEAAVNVKCDPEYTIQLREEYNSVEPGYHMSKKHWNTLRLYKGELSPKLVLELIDHSYDSVVKTLPKKKQQELKDL